MKCVVASTNVKAFAQILHCLAKIGDDLFLDPTANSLELKTKNLSQSAFVSFLFGSKFFSQYIYGNDNQRLEQLKCRTSMKGILMVFRSLVVIEKTVDQCLLEFTPQELQIKLQCKHFVTKSYTLPIFDSESLNADYNNTSAPNRFVVPAKIFSEAFLNFLNNQEEVSMLTNQSRFQLKNWNESPEHIVQNTTLGLDKSSDAVSGKSVHTELIMQPGEFEDFSISFETQLTFCLRELRAFVALAESLGLSLSVLFDRPGDPLVFSTKTDNIMESNLVMATLNQTTGNLGEPPAQPDCTNQECSTKKNSTPIHTDISRPRDTPNLSVICPNQSGIVEQSFVQGPPPNKKAKFFFKRCFNSTFNPNNVLGSEKVLAPDSDEET